MSRNPTPHRPESVPQPARYRWAQPAELDTDRQLQAVPTRHVVPSVAWWAREFPGGAEQVREARHWIEDLLPDCDPLADILLLASELCANAVMHTRSREAGGWFSVDVEWGLELARVVIGDQGSLTVPAVGGRPGETVWTEEFGRGLWLVDEVADDWGTGCHPAGRVVWVDVRWQARGGPPLQAPGGIDDVVADVTSMRRAFPEATIWWGHQTRAWWAALSGATGSSGLISSPTTGGLRKLLADACPQFRQVDRVGSSCAVPPREAVALLISDQPENDRRR